MNRRYALLIPVFVALAAAGCGQSEPQLWRLYHEENVRFEGPMSPVPARVAEGEGVAVRDIEYPLDGSALTLHGGVSVVHPGDLVGIEIRDSANLISQAVHIKFRIWPQGDSASAAVSIRDAPLRIGRAFWPAIHLDSREYEWSASVIPLPMDGHRPDLRAKVVLRWADYLKPGLHYLQILDETRPSLLLYHGVSAVCRLPHRGRWMLQTGIGRPPGIGNGGTITLQIRSPDGSRGIGRFVVTEASWVDTSISVVIRRTDEHISFECTGGPVLLGAPILISEGSQNRRKRCGPNVLLVSLDTVRADHLAQGDAFELTPGLGSFAARSVVFERAISQASVTDESHHSIFTGLHVLRHGGYDHMSPYADIPSLATVLERAGYRTAAFTDNSLVSARFGFARGYESYWEDSRSLNEKNHLPDILTHSTQWLSRVGSERPWYLFVHTYQAHSPYIDRREPPWSSVRIQKKRERSPITSLPEQIIISGDAGELAPDSLLAMAREAYRSEVRYLDRLISSFLDALERDGLLKNTLVVIFSDHGEAFFEHGFMEHDNSLYDEAIRVPLLIHFPEGQYGGTTVSEVVQTVDILPTILEFLNIEMPVEMDGASLLEACRLGSARPRSALSTHSSLFSVTIWPHKLIIPREQNGGELYRLDTDPLESRNILSEVSPSILDALIDSLLHMIDLSHDGFIAEVTRPEEKACRLVFSGKRMDEVSCLLPWNQDRMRPQTSRLDLRIGTAPFSRLFLLLPPGHLPVVRSQKGEILQLSEGIATLGSLQIRVWRSSGRRHPRDEDTRASMPKDLEKRLRQLGYLP